jgi:Type II CAAX prenyl endopeptidase Rce1-like
MPDNHPTIPNAGASNETKSSMLRQRVALPEALLFAAFVMAYIWWLQSIAFYSWLVFAVWLILSFAFHGDTPESLGWRADNLWPATRQAILPCATLIALIVATGPFLGALHRYPSTLLQPQRFISYLAFCLLQELGLQSFLMNRLLAVLEKPVLCAVIAGAIFAVMHWPNPVLMPLTFLGGALLCWLFARQRNIIPLAVAQAILGSLVWWAFPQAWHHGMRVGPGYYSFQLRAH